MRCSLHDDGTHRSPRMVYSPSKCGLVARCDCGKETMVVTDEQLAANDATSPFMNNARGLILDNLTTGDDWYPPHVEYPEDHSPMCHRSCTHPCHEPYDEWKRRQP